MTTRAEQARLFNEAIAQGLSEDQALAAAGITDDNSFTYGTNGQLEPAVIGPPRRPNETIVPAGQSIDYGDADEETQFRTTPVSSSSTTTSQETVTGGTVRTTRVTPTVYADNDQSRALSQQAQSLEDQKAARAAELRGQGLSGAQVLRDPEYRRLSAQAQETQNEAQDARTPVQSGTVTVITEPGDGIQEETTVPTSYLVNDSTGVDPYANEQEVDEIAEPTPLNLVDSPADVDTGNDFVFNEDGELVPADSAEAERIRAIEPDEQIDPYTAVTGSGDPVLSDEEIDAARADQQIVFGPDGLTTLTTAEATRQQATLQRARAQQILSQQRKQANDGDWRVRLRLAPNAEYLYKAEQPGILQPLAVTDGVIFPYTPQITTAYKATYNSYNLTHSNYRGFFYQGSQVEDIQMNAIFTAQDTAEANYLLAVIHFFRSVTKMFYGQDAQRGAPPPLVFLQGLGEYQFNLAPCVVTQFNYNLPADVDYIRAGSPNINGTNLLQRRERQDLPTNPFTAAWKRLQNAGLKPGAINTPPAPPTLGTNRPTYVPTRIEISLILHPMQTREQVSKQFSLKQYANGDLLKGGFW